MNGLVPSQTFRTRILLGTTSYAEGYRLQQELLTERQAGRGPDTLLLLEHSPVITMGRNADPAEVLADTQELDRRGIQLRRVERGGQATYHGPGQIVGYPIFHLRERGIGVRTFVERIEEILIDTCGHFGVAAYRVAGRPGAFTARGKIAAIGLAISKGVSYHGFSLNVRPDLGAYRWIVPCGLTDIAVTSMAEGLRERCPDQSIVTEQLAARFSRRFGIRDQAPDGHEEVYVSKSRK